MEADWKNPGIRARMYELAGHHGIRRIYAPNPSEFNGIIARPDAFDVEWAEDRVLRGPMADGVLLTEPGTAFAVSSADCPTAVLYDIPSGLVVAAHAGFRGLLDMEKLPLAHEMAMAIKTLFGEDSYDCRLHRGFIACGIGHNAYAFDASHAAFTETHRLMCERVEEMWPEAVLRSDDRWLIDLPTLFRVQLETWSTDRSRVGSDGACTRSDISRYGPALWHSNRRGDTSRNLVLVIRRE